MASAINGTDFADPVSRRLARGESLGGANEIWLDPWGHSTVPITNGGIVDPEPYEIAAGTKLYRFSSTSGGAEEALRGGWWLERRELDHLVRYAQVNDKTLGYAVRLLCCVPPEWGSALNFLVAVEAAGRLLAWRGLANSAVGVSAPNPTLPPFAQSVTRITARNDIAGLRVPQLFIPGTRRPGATAAMFRYQGQWQTEGARDWIFGSGS
jgi:hypothetical protein